jgi:hypothetical protein
VSAKEKSVTPKWLKFDQTEGRANLVCDRCAGFAQLPDSCSATHLFDIFIEFAAVHGGCPETWEESQPSR